MKMRFAGLLLPARLEIVGSKRWNNPLAFDSISTIKSLGINDLAEVGARVKMRVKFLAFFAFFAGSSPAYADFLVIPIDQSSMPYELSPDRYDNSPQKYDNSSEKYENSASNYDNSPDKYENSSSKYENGPSGDNRLLLKDGKYIGYYNFSKKGVLNLYGRKTRIAFMPSGGTTQSLFLSEGNAWCGTIGRADGEAVIGITPKCLLRLLAEQ